MSNTKEENIKKKEKGNSSEIIKDAKSEEVEFNELLEKHPELIEEHVLKQFEIRKTYSGPIPDPETLRGYKQVQKNAPEIIIRMATKEQSFRHFSTYFGQFSALTIGLGGLIVTAYLGVNEQPWLAGVIGFGSLGSLVGVFLHQNRK